MDNNPWRTLETKVLYENPWFRLREDEVIRPDGKTGIYSFIEVLPSVAIVAVNSEAEVILAGQWRYPTNIFSWEIPMGGLAHAQEGFLAAAKRELLEETGLIAENWQQIGEVHNSNSMTTDVINLFVASALTTQYCKPDDTERIKTKWVKFASAVEMALDGSITDASTVAAILKSDRIFRLTNNYAAR
jgi:8-oxo-dGTP pyrophosphatase MutT (NUDIX family)